MEDFQKQARDFLDRFELGVKIVREDKKPWAWGGQHPRHHHQYRVTIYRRGSPARKMGFDYWGSEHDWENKIEPTAYDALSSLSGTQNLDSRQEIVGNFGEDGVQGLEVGLIIRVARRMKQFFSEAELGALDEIQ